MAVDQGGGDLTRLRQLNARAVIRALRGEEPLALTEVARRTGLSRASTEDIVRELLGHGWITEVLPASGVRGRPARRYRFHSEMGKVLGLDVGTHEVVAVVTDLDGSVLHSAQVTVSLTAGRAERLRAADETVDACLAGARIGPGDVWCSGVGTAGLVNPAGRVMFADALPEWTGVDLGKHVGARIHGPVLVEGDSKLAVLGERWRGVARYADSVAYFLARSRIGAGLIVGGRLHQGFANAAGEIGALPALGWAQAEKRLSTWRGHDQGGSWTPDVFDAARSGDQGAITAVRRYARDIAPGVAAVVLTIDPQLVVVGGALADFGDLVVEPLRRELDKWCVRAPEIRASTLGNQGVAMGAVRLALDHIEERTTEGRLGSLLMDRTER